MTNILPVQLREFYFPFNWNLQNLWALPVDMQQLEVDDFAWHLDIPIWSETKGTMAFDLCPRMVLENQAEHLCHYKQALDADLRFPIDIMESGGRLVIIDGVYRLLKAIIRKQKYINGRVISRDLIPEFCED